MPEESSGAIHRTLVMLREVNKRRGRWFGVTEIANAVGCSKGLAHHYLTVFVEEGILQHTDATRKYAVAGSVPMVRSLDKAGQVTTPHP